MRRKEEKLLEAAREGDISTLTDMVSIWSYTLTASILLSILLFLILVWPNFNNKKNEKMSDPGLIHWELTFHNDMPTYIKVE